MTLQGEGKEGGEKKCSLGDPIGPCIQKERDLKSSSQKKRDNFGHFQSSCIDGVM